MFSVDQLSCYTKFKNNLTTKKINYTAASRKCQEKVRSKEAERSLNKKCR